MHLAKIDEQYLIMSIDRRHKAKTSRLCGITIDRRHIGQLSFESVRLVRSLMQTENDTGKQ